MSLSSWRHHLRTWWIYSSYVRVFSVGLEFHDKTWYTYMFPYMWILIAIERSFLVTLFFFCKLSTKFQLPRFCPLYFSNAWGMLARDNLSPSCRPPFLFLNSPKIECFLSLLPFSPNNYFYARLPWSRNWCNHVPTGFSRGNIWKRVSLSGVILSNLAFWRRNCNVLWASKKVMKPVSFYLDSLCHQIESHHELFLYLLFPFDDRVFIYFRK